MGSGASAAVKDAKVEDITEALKGLSSEDLKKVQDAMMAAAAGAKLVGSPTIHIALRVPKDKEAEMDEYWKSHEALMKSDHKLGVGPEDLLEFYISKGMELKDPMDPNSGETGNLLYVMSETYVSPQGIAKHMEIMGSKWEGMKTLGEKCKEYGVAVQIGSAKVLTCFEDKAVPFTIAKDQPSLHMLLRVPKEKESDMDAYWKEHEAAMRKTHCMGLAGDEPRLTSFYIAKGVELEDPMNPASAETGNILYNMSETYAAPEGIAKHMEVMAANWEGMKTLPDKVKEHAVHMDIGSTKVFTSIA